MKNIKTIISALLIAAGTNVQAQQVMTVKTNNSNDKFQLTSRLVLDLTGQRPVVRTNSQNRIYETGESLLLYLMPTSDETYRLIDDATSFYNPEDRLYKQITYTRNFQDLSWHVLYLPLRLEYDEWKDNFDIAFINDIHQYDRDRDGIIDITELNTVLLRNGHTEPNTPYVIRSHSTGNQTIIQDNATLYASEQIETYVSTLQTDFTICGTYNIINANDMPSNSFYVVRYGYLQQGENEPLGAFRWYVNANNHDGSPTTIQTIRISEYNIDEDAINIIGADEKRSGKIYDLSGRTINRPIKGIYIKDGKKILVK